MDITTESQINLQMVVWLIRDCSWQYLSKFFCHETMIILSRLLITSEQYFWSYHSWSLIILFFSQKVRLLFKSQFFYTFTLLIGSNKIIQFHVQEGQVKDCIVLTQTLVVDYPALHSKDIYLLSRYMHSCNQDTCAVLAPPVGILFFLSWLPCIKFAKSKATVVNHYFQRHYLLPLFRHLVSYHRILALNHELCKIISTLHRFVILRFYECKVNMLRILCSSRQGMM